MLLVIASVSFVSHGQAPIPIKSFRGIDIGSDLKTVDRTECPRSGINYIFPIGDEFEKIMAGRQCWAAMNSFALKLSSPLFALHQIHNVSKVPGVLSTVGTVIMNGRIEAMESLFGRQSYINVRDAMVDKYGPFDKEVTITFKNRLGESYAGRRATWSRSNATLIIDEQLESGDFSAISVYSKKYLDSLSSASGSTRDSIKNGI